MAHPAVVSPPARRWLARFALAAAAGAVVLVLTAAGIRGSAGLLLAGALGAAAGLAGAWTFLSRRGALRWLAAVVVVLGPASVAVVYIRHHLLWVVIAFGLLWATALAAGRQALADAGDGPAEYETPPPRHPYLIMNPRSGGGKVDRFHLAELARGLGARVHLLDGPAVDVAALARNALADGADLLGVAGGDGTQALVAGIAAEHRIPFMVIPAGTRNHFALDLGLDRENPALSLDALTDGVELRVDLGLIGDRTFVNNASFGAYAAVVQSPAYRDDKTGTALDVLPGVLAGAGGPDLRLRMAGETIPGPRAVLVSNNPYTTAGLAGIGQRPRLDLGMLGVLVLTVRGAADAARLVSGRGRARSVTARVTTEAIIDADAPAVPVGIDGEAVVLPTPVRCSIRPGALRVRVPRHRPGTGSAPPELDWARLRRLAMPSRRS